MANELSRAEVLENAGKKLREQYGDKAIPRKEIVKYACMNSSYAQSSILPSDFCYNCLNKDPVSASMANAMFVKIERGLYEFLGRGQSYSGEVTWTPKGMSARPVGRWVDGDYQPYATNP